MIIEKFQQIIGISTLIPDKINKNHLSVSNLENKKANKIKLILSKQYKLKSFKLPTIKPNKLHHDNLLKLLER